MSNNALQRAIGYRGRPALAKEWRARRGGMGIVPAAELFAPSATAGRGSPFHSLGVNGT